MNENPEFLKVRDTLAVVGARRHELAPGKRFELTADSDTEVPYALAHPLISIPGFEVRMPNGTLIRQMKATDDAGEQMTLRTDQVVAELSELTADSLAKRCAAAGIVGYHARSGRTEMIEALLANAAQTAATSDEPAEVVIDYAVDGAPEAVAA